MKITKQRLKEIIKEEMKNLYEKTVKLSTMKDANFGSDFVQLMGKKGMVKLDKKSVHKLAKIVRQLSGKKGMGWSFTQHEEKLTEGVFGKFDTGINFRGNGLTVYDRNQSKGGDFKSIAFIANGKVKLYDKDVKKEPKLMKALQNIAKSQLQVEGKLNEGSKVVRLPNGVKVKIDFKGLTFLGGTKPVFLDRTEMMNFFKATAKYLR